jgi:hypothetical protein
MIKCWDGASGISTMERFASVTFSILLRIQESDADKDLGYFYQARYGRCESKNPEIYGMYN